MTRRKFQTSAEETLESGLYFTSESVPPEIPSKTGSTCAVDQLRQHITPIRQGTLGCIDSTMLHSPG